MDNNFQDGWIGGFRINSDSIIDVVDSMGMSSLLTTADDVRFWAGSTYENRASAAFNVTRAGVLRATGAIISGTITASAGTLGGFTIGATSLEAGSGSSLISIANGGVPRIRLGDPASSSSISMSVSQLIGEKAAGEMWRLQEDQIVSDSGQLLLKSSGVTAVELSTDGLVFATDTNLYRSAANTLKTDDAFEAAGKAGMGIASSSTAALTVAAGTTGVSSFRVPHGAAPTSPVDGDIWTTAAGLYVRISGATVGPLS